MSAVILAADGVNVAENVAFGIIATIMIFAALNVVTTKNVVHAAPVALDRSRTPGDTTPPIIIGPLVYDGHIIDDDNTGGTSGDGSGYVNCGETVGLVVMLRNEGNTAVEGIDTTLSFVGGTGAGEVDWIGNTTSTYPNIAGGASAGNSQAFEFSVEQLAEHGHWIDFELTITEGNWSGGPIEFSLPILCSATADFRHYLPLIFR